MKIYPSEKVIRKAQIVFLPFSDKKSAQDFSDLRKVSDK